MQKQVSQQGRLFAVISVLRDVFTDKIINCNYTLINKVYDAGECGCDLGERGKVEYGFICKGNSAVR